MNSLKEITKIFPFKQIRKELLTHKKTIKRWKYITFSLGKCLLLYYIWFGAKFFIDWPFFSRYLYLTQFALFQSPPPVNFLLILLPFISVNSHLLTFKKIMFQIKIFHFEMNSDDIFIFRFTVYILYALFITKFL